MNYFNSVKTNPLITDIILFVVRIFVGFAMISHGFPKLMKLMGDEEIKFFDFLELWEAKSL